MSLIKILPNTNFKLQGKTIFATSGGGGGGGNGGGNGGGGNGGGDIFFANWTTLPTVGDFSFGQTTYQGSCTFSINNNNLEIDDRTGLTSFNAAYTYANTNTTVDASNCSNLTILSIPGNGMTALDISNCPNLTTIDFGYNSPSITSINLANCPNLSTVILWGNPLNNTIVNSMLAQLVQNGKTGGTLYASQAAAPTGAGLTDKATLESRGWTIYTS